MLRPQMTIIIHMITLHEESDPVGEWALTSKPSVRTSRQMRRFKYLTMADIEAICLLADARKSVPAGVAPDWQIRPDSENGRQLDELLTRGLSPAHLTLLRRIQQLPREAQIELATLAWFGRGDAPFDQVKAHAVQAYSSTLPYYLADKVELGNYLRQGLRRP